MPKHIFIENILPGTNGLNEPFSIKDLQKHTAKNGDPYYRIVLQDKTGSAQGKIWKDSFTTTQVESLTVNSIVAVDYEASEFNNQLQLTIKRTAKVEEYDINDFVKVSGKDVNGMFTQMVNILESIKDREIRGVLLSIIKDERIAKKLRTAIAAEYVHHDYVGGLLEHTLEIIAIAETIIKLYPRANRSIVLAGAFLHDIGKIDELGVEQTNFIRTLPGYLVGHIAIGLLLFEKFVPPGFTEEKKLAIEHIILSHHREPEFGAVVRPATLEASIVSVADFASSTVRQFQKDIDEKKPDEMGFGDFHKFQKNRIYHKQLQEEE